jgi:hypothetical protein
LPHRHPLPVALAQGWIGRTRDGLASLMRPAQIVLNSSLVKEHDRFIRLSGRPRHLALHAGGVTPDEGNIIEHFLPRDRVNILCDGLVRNGVRLIVAVEGQVSGWNILVGEEVFRVDAHGLVGVC